VHKALQAENATPILVQNNNKEAKMHPNKPQEKQGVPQWRVSVSHEVNEQAFNLTNWAQEYNQCSAGRFEGRVDECHFDGIQIINEYTNQTLYQQCITWPDAFWIGIPNQREQFRINGQEVEPEDVLWRLGHHSFELMTPADCHILSILIRRDELFALAEREGISVEHLADSATPCLKSNTQQVDTLSLLVRQILTASSDAMNTDIHKDMLLQELLSLLDSGTLNSAKAPSYLHRRAVVDRVWGYLKASGDSPVTITALCDIACVSRRTLQYSFESILGISPVQFLRATRLNRVRRQLLSHGDISIADAAASQGFYHLSQFALDYKRLFYERPSETRKRTLH